MSLGSVPKSSQNRADCDDSGTRHWRDPNPSPLRNVTGGRIGSEVSGHHQDGSAHCRSSLHALDTSPSVTPIRVLTAYNHPLESIV